MWHQSCQRCATVHCLHTLERTLLSLGLLRCCPDAGLFLRVLTSSDVLMSFNYMKQRCREEREGESWWEEISPRQALLHQHLMGRPTSARRRGLGYLIQQKVTMI